MPRDELRVVVLTEDELSELLSKFHEFFIAQGVVAKLAAAPTLKESVERLAGFMSSTEPYQHTHPENLKGHASRALDAALSPDKEEAEREHYFGCTEGTPGRPCCEAEESK